MERELQHRRNNAYDTVLLIESGIVIGAWCVGNDGKELADYRNPGDVNDWEPNFPDSTRPDEYGELLSSSQ